MWSKCAQVSNSLLWASFIIIIFNQRATSQQPQILLNKKLFLTSDTQPVKINKIHIISFEIDT